MLKVFLWNVELQADGFARRSYLR